MRIHVWRGAGRGVAALALLASAGCSDGPTAVHLNDIVGTWNLVHLNRTNATTGESTDAMASGDIQTFEMTVSSLGSVTTVATYTSAPPVNGAGTIAVSGNRTKLVLDGTSYYGTIVLKDGQLTIDCGVTVGLEEFSRIAFVFARP